MCIWHKFQFSRCRHICNSLHRNAVSHTKCSKLFIILRCRFRVSSSTGSLVIAKTQKALQISYHFRFYKNTVLAQTVRYIFPVSIAVHYVRTTSSNLKVTHLRIHHFLASRKLKCMALSYPILVHCSYKIPRNSIKNFAKFKMGHTLTNRMAIS